MRVCILGAGITGVTTAWFLAERGYDVTVIDREGNAACATSYANGCSLTPGHSKPWNDPSAPGQLLRSLVSRDPELAIRWRSAGSEFWAWGPRFLMACRRSIATRNADSALKLALYSRELTLALADELVLDRDTGAKHGILYVHYDEATFASDRKHAQYLLERGLDARSLTDRECLFREPLLARADRLPEGGIFIGDDLTLDCRAFTRDLARLCSYELDVTFSFDTEFSSLGVSGDTIVNVQTSKGELATDIVVACLGPWSGRLAKQLRFNLPVYPVRGYALTVGTEHPDDTPRHAMVDGDSMILMTPLGAQLRLVGGVHFAGYDRTWTKNDFKRHWSTLDKFKIRADQSGEAEHWACLRAMTPDGLPIVAQAPSLKNLWLNTGHCYLGWTWGMGTAAIVSAMIAGEQPDLDPAPYCYRW